MKKVRNFIAAILSGILVISSLPIPLSVSALESSAAPSGTLWADGNPNLDSADQTAQDAVKWFASEDQGCEITSLSNNSNHYYLFLPSTADLNNLTLWHTFSSNPKIGDVEIKIVVNNGYGNGKQTENLDAFSHMSIMPSLSPYKTKQDDEALKSYYECTVSDFYEDKVVKSEYTVGDVDNDNNITSADALKILRISVSLEDFEKPSDFSLGDVDKDNSITSNDALLVLRKSVGFADELKIIGTKQIDYSYNKS